jgi:hypothetical protein
VCCLLDYCISYPMHCSVNSTELGFYATPCCTCVALSLDRQIQSKHLADIQRIALYVLFFMDITAFTFTFDLFVTGRYT